jgi:hypothetical protein
MPRELALGGIYVPTLLILFLAAAAAYLVIDWLLARVGAYRWVWHLDLFRLCLFSILFAAAGISVYR